MGNKTRRLLGRYAVRTLIAIIPTAMVAMMSTNLLASTEKIAPVARTLSIAVINTAAIVDESSTIGFADSDLYGLSNPDGTLDTAAVNKTLDAMQALGVNDVRVLIPWAFVEPVPPGYLGVQPDWSRTDYIINAANARGMGVLGVITGTPTWGVDPTSGGYGYSASPDVADYTAFTTAVATRYVGKVSAYEVSNEVNSIYGWTPSPDASDYTTLLKSAYTAIKASDPNAMVVAGALVTVYTVPGLTVNAADYVSQMYADGAKGYFDALSIHPYQYTTQFSQGGYDPNGPISQLIDIRQLMIANGDSALKIWATEYGLPTGGPNGVSQQVQADFIKDFLQTWAGTDYAGPAFIYTTRDQPGNENTENGSFGVYTSDWQQKLAAKVIAALTTPTPPPDPTGPTTPVDPGKAIADALNAIFQQAINAYAQGIAAAAQQIVQAAATAYVNALAQALNAALGALFSSLTVPAPQQQAIVEGVTAARMNVANLKVEPTAVDDPTPTAVDGSTAGGVEASALDGGTTVSTVKVDDPATTPVTTTTPAATTPAPTTPAVTTPTPTTPAATTPVTTTTPAATTPAPTTPAVTTPAVTTPAPTTPAATTPAATTPTANGTTPAASTPAASTPAASTPAASTPAVGGSNTPDPTTKSDPPAKTTDSSHPRKWKKRNDDGTDENGNGTPKVDATNSGSPGIRKRQGSDPSTSSKQTTSTGSESPAPQRTPVAVTTP